MPTAPGGSAKWFDSVDDQTESVSAARQIRAVASSRHVIVRSPSVESPTKRARTDPKKSEIVKAAQSFWQMPEPVALFRKVIDEEEIEDEEGEFDVRRAIFE